MATASSSGSSNEKKLNRLALEKSPYLLQHATNPVDWYPWGDEAFEIAKAQNKPIFLSVGYSTCHWCHVMEKESFENEEVAEIMNEYFVNIKVDREERPDVDRMYMSFIQATSGRRGWPMSVFLTPTLAPLAGGTYFPLRGKNMGAPNFPDLLLSVADQWQNNCQSLTSSGLSTHLDSELITQALCLNPPEGEPTGEPNWPARIRHFMQLAPLSYSLVIMLKNKIYAVRDPYGNRPLCLGKIVPVSEPLSEYCNENKEAEGWVVSSESCGFLSIGAQYVREVYPGEIIEMTRHGIRTIDIVHRPDNKASAFCIFEYVYFARTDSIFEGQMVYAVRLQCGKQLAVEHPVEADIVSAVPESGNAAAHGFSRQSGISFGEVLCKNRYVGRSFIQPSNRLRQLLVAKKFGALSGMVKGKRIILVDDSIVRGNTIGPIIKLLKNAGAAEVHIRVASPPLQFPCYMGINIPTREELIANKLNSRELAKHVGADSLEYLSLPGLIKAVRSDIKTKNNSKVGHCTACLNGVYPGGDPVKNPDLDW